MAAWWVAGRRSRLAGLNKKILLDWAVWAIIAAFVGARLADVFFYNWPIYSSNPLNILKVWQGGLSSFGGFIGAAAASVIYARVKKIDFWEYADAIMYGFPLGLGIGRLGCFISHLHIGKPSNFFLAVAFPGGPRLDMGLIESILGFAVFAIYFLFLRKTSQPIFLPLTMVIYGAARFILDFWRATDLPYADTRYLSLTPAQYGSVLLVLGGVYIFKLRSHQIKSFKVC